MCKLTHNKAGEHRAPEFLENRHMESGKVVSPTRRPPLPPGDNPRYSCLLEAESTPVTHCGWKDQINEKSQ